MQPPAKRRDVDLLGARDDVDAAVGAREDDLGVLERVDAARLAEQAGVLFEEGEVGAHLAPRDAREDGVGHAQGVPKAGDEVQGAGDVGRSGCVLSCWFLLCVSILLKRRGRLPQLRKGPSPPLLRLGQDGIDLARDAARQRHGAGQGEDEKGGELAADEEDEGEEGEAAEVVGPAAAEEEAGAGGAPVGGDARHGGGGDAAGGRGRVGGDAAGGVEGPDEAGVEVDVLQARLVKDEVGLARLVEVRRGARPGGARGEVERGRAGGRGGVRGGRREGRGWGGRGRGRRGGDGRDGFFVVLALGDVGEEARARREGSLCGGKPSGQLASSGAQDARLSSGGRHLIACGNRIQGQEIEVAPQSRKEDCWGRGAVKNFFCPSVMTGVLRQSLFVHKV